MAISADKRWRDVAASGRPSGPVAGDNGSAAIGPTLALTATLAVACFVVVMVPVELLVEPTRLAPPLNVEQKQDAETALYLLSFGLILPAALLLVPRLADSIAAGRNGAGLPSLAALLVAALGAAIAAAHLAPGGGVVETGVTVAIWSLGAAAALWRASRTSAWESLLRVAPLAPLLWTGAAVVVLCTLLAFTVVESISVVGLALGLLASVAVWLAYARTGSNALPRPRRGLGLVIDLFAIGLILLAVPDLVIFDSSDRSGGGLIQALRIPVAQFHHDFVLGPANVLLHGGAMLVDTASQYGIVSIYFVTGWFQLAPIGYGTLGLLDGILFALVYAAGYGVLRLARTPRLLAVTALAISVVVLIYNLLWSVGSLPAQHGPLRFGLPMLVVVAAAAATRLPERGRLLEGLQIAVVGLASVWALEGFIYTAATFAALACFRAFTAPPTGRLAWLARRAGLVVVACVVAHLLFVAGTLAFAGELPDYGWYLGFLREFLFGQLGDLTYDFSAWSPGLPVAAAYATSAAALVLVVRRSPGVLRRERPALTVIAGCTGYGIILFSYFVDRSADYILAYVSLPVVLLGALWLAVVLRSAPHGSPGYGRGALAFALGVAVLVTSVAWSSLDERFPRSALAHAAPGGRSLGGALERLWNLPPLDERTPGGEALVERYMPGRGPLLSVVEPDLETEIMIRSGRINRLPLSFAPEDSFLSSRHVPELRGTVAGLRAGDRMLTQDVALNVIRTLEAEPSRDPLDDPVAPAKLAPLQEWVLRGIDRRFRLRILRRDRDGLVVAVLEPRR
jgi:hypothetical protein